MPRSMTLRSRSGSIAHRMGGATCPPSLTESGSETHHCAGRSLGELAEAQSARLICRHGKSNPGIELRQINPTGKSLLIFRNRVKPRNKKYSAFALGQISARTSAVPCPQEGRFAIVTDVGCGMRWTRQRQASECEPDE